MTKHILTATVLLLSLFGYAAAQAQVDGSKDLPLDQNLVGLAEIGLIVKYGRSDALPEAKRAALLQMVTDRARDLLTKGEVRLFESNDEANLVGRPHLVVTLRLNKPTDTPPALQVETDLYQKVRLSRDPGKEFQLVTWNASNIGPEPTEEKLAALLDGQLNAFVKNYRAANASSPQPATATADLPPPIKNASLVRRPQSETFMSTWQSYTSQGWPISEEVVRKIMNSQLDKFIEAYKAANPKSSATN